MFYHLSLNFFLLCFQIGAKHMQTISGVSPLSYWVSTFLWDFITFMIPCLLLIGVFFVYSSDAFVADDRWLIVILVLAIYGWAVLPFTYVLSFVIKTPPAGVVAAIALNIGSGKFSFLRNIFRKCSPLFYTQKVKYERIKTLSSLSDSTENFKQHHKKGVKETWGIPYTWQN